MQPCICAVARLCGVVLQQPDALTRLMRDSDLGFQLLYNQLYYILNARPGRQAWAIARDRASVEDLAYWRESGFTNKIERFYIDNLRMSQPSFELLLSELELHPSMAVDEQAFRAPHPTWRKLMAWLFWVGRNASLPEVDQFSGISSGSLAKQGRRGRVCWAT